MLAPDDVKTMSDIRARAEFLAWMTRDAYRDAYKNSFAPAAERGALWLKAYQYKRRAIRVSQYLNRRG